jgi:hypothetical protein
MTTTVTIKHEGPDHHDVFVASANPQTREILDSKRLAAGEAATFYVHSSLGLTVSEVSKLQPNTK